MLLSVLLFVVVVVAGGVGYLMLNPPSDLIRQTLVEQVKQKTGRDLTVAGPASFTFWPGLGVSLGNVSLSGPPGSPEPLVTMRALDVSVQLMPLLQRHIAVDRISLEQPVFNLAVDRDGRKNWDMAATPTPRRLAAANSIVQNDAQPLSSLVVAAADGASEEKIQRREAAIQALELRDVRVRNGTVRYSDARSGAQQQISGLNVDATMPGLNRTMSADGDLIHRKEKLNFEARLTSPVAVLAERPADLKLKAYNDIVTFNFDGKLAVGRGADLSGRVAVDTPSARNAAVWLGTTLPPVSGFGPLSIKAKVKTSGNVTRLDDASVQLDDTRAAGTLVVTTGGVRPYVTADLKVDAINLNSYLTAAAGGAIATEGGSNDRAAPMPDAGDQPADGPADDIEKLLKRGTDDGASAPTRVYGAVQRAGWSSEALNLALLNVADIDAKVSSGPLQFRKIKVDRADARVALMNRQLTTEFTRLDLYGGRGNGTLSVKDQGAGQAARQGGAIGVGSKFSLSGLAARPFLQDAADMDWLDGNANVTLDITANGASQLQLVETLAGTSRVAFSNGAIVGFNLAGAIRNLTQGNFTGLKASPREKTDFSEMSASFNIANGVARNSDLALISPLLRVTGEGAINLPPRTVNYMVRPKLVASLEGQGASNVLKGLEIPVRIVGPLDKPRFEPDLSGVLSNPGQAVEAVQEIGKRLKGKNSGEIMDEVFGKDDSPTKSKAKDLLNRFLNKN